MRARNDGDRSTHNRGLAVTKKTDLQRRLEKVISRMQHINRKIADEGQPPTQKELDELTSLGRQYTELIAQLARISHRVA